MSEIRHYVLMHFDDNGNRFFIAICGGDGPGYGNGFWNGVTCEKCLALRPKP